MICIVLVKEYKIIIFVISIVRLFLIFWRCVHQYFLFTVFVATYPCRLNRFLSYGETQLCKTSPHGDAMSNAHPANSEGERVANVL